MYQVQIHKCSTHGPNLVTDTDGPGYATVLCDLPSLAFLIKAGFNISFAEWSIIKEDLNPNWFDACGGQCITTPVPEEVWHALI